MARGFKRYSIKLTENTNKKREVTMNQSVVLRKRQGMTTQVTTTPGVAVKAEAVKVQVPLTPESTFLTAYEQVSKSINTEAMDYLQATAESILTRIKSKDIDPDSWECQSIENMTVYIKGCVKKRQIKTEQSKAVIDCISFVELSNKGIELADTTYTPKVDLFDWIRGAKRYNGKPLFDEHERELISQYYEQGLSTNKINPKDSKKVWRQLESISQRITKLPIRDMHGFIECQGVKTSVQVELKEYRPLVTRIGLLRRYRRTKDKAWRDKYNANSERVLTEHECRVNAPVDMTPLDTGSRGIEHGAISNVPMTVLSAVKRVDVI